MLTLEAFLRRRRIRATGTWEDTTTQETLFYLYSTGDLSTTSLLMLGEVPVKGPCLTAPPHPFLFF